MAGLGAVLGGGFRALTGAGPPYGPAIRGESILPAIGRLKAHPGHLPLPRFSIRTRIKRKVDGDSTFGVLIYVDPAGITWV